jgi:hypothetical protein
VRRAPPHASRAQDGPGIGAKMPRIGHRGGVDMKRTLVVGTLVLVAAAACGKSEEQKAADQMSEAAEQIRQGAEKMAEGAQNASGAAQNGMAQMMQGLQQMAGAANGGQPVQVVDYEKLKELLPDVPGWEKSDAKGSQNSMGNFSVSKAEARYRKGDSTVDLTITDTTSVSFLLAPFMMFGANYSERSDDGYKKGIKLDGMTGFEEWQKNRRHAEVSVLVANRFIVQTEASKVDSADVPRAILQAVDLSKLASLK